MQTSRKLPIINGLRGVAILGVLTQHISFGHRIPTWQDLPTDGLGTVLWGIIFNGSVGVPLFFLLSGFVLALPYMTGERSMEQWPDLRAFAQRRMRRLLPLYAIAVGVGVIVMQPDRTLFSFLRGMTMMATFVFPFVGHHYPPYNPVLWSLGYEVWFCLLFPFILALFKRCGSIPVAIILCAASLVARDIEVWRLPIPLEILTLVLSKADTFILGMLLADLIQQRPHAIHRFTLPVGLLLILCSSAVVDYLQHGPSPTPASDLYTSLSSLGLALTVWSLMQFPRGIPALLCTMWPLQMLGLMSYSIFVWHFFTLRGVDPNISTGNFIEYGLLTFLLSALSYRYIEFGWQNNLRSLLPQRQHEHSVAELPAVLSTGIIDP